jgi:UDP-N-acetylglucosamine 2-epimerase (non-hydrolysing)
MQFPAINLRDNHERPEGMEEASVIMTGLDINKIQHAIEILTNKENKSSHVVADYKKNNVSDKIIKIILSYINYVNLYVWKKIY